MGLLELDSGSSTWMNVKSTVTPAWQKVGTASGQPLRTAATAEDRKRTVCRF